MHLSRILRGSSFGCYKISVLIYISNPPRFDSIWSWLANTLPDSRPLSQASLTLPQPPNGPKLLNVQEDPYAPLAQADLEPLVQQIIRDYSCADLLYLLPGSIPIPSFSIEPAVPSTDWIDPMTRRFRPKVLEILASYRGLGQSPTLRPSIPFPFGKTKAFDRQIVPAPLIVRHPSSDVYSPSGRARILELVGIPKGNTSRILIVSFGGQKFKRPYSACPTPSTATPSTEQPSPEIMPQSDVDKLHHVTQLHLTPSTPTPAPRHSSHNFRPGSHSLRFPNTHPVLLRRNFSDPPRVATPTHIYIPGAPGPISNPNSPEHSARSPGVNGEPRTRVHEPAPGQSCFQMVGSQLYAELAQIGAQKICLAGFMSRLETYTCQISRQSEMFCLGSLGTGQYLNV